MATVLAVLGATACGDRAGDGAPGAGGEVETSTATGQAEAAPAVRLTGFLTVDDAVVLSLCGTGDEYRVDGPAYADLLDLHAVLAPGIEPLEGVFVDVLGVLRDGPGEATVEVLEVRRAAWEGGGCGDSEADLLFRASGTEPFWSLTVLGESMTWRTPEDRETLEHRGVYRSDRGDWLVDGTAPGLPRGSGSPPDLTARFYPEPCQDAMSGAWFHMSAEVTFRGRDYRGCAYAGGEG